MTTFELDPLFVKALKLLHSKSKDSADQLKQLLDDVIAQRKGETTKKDGKDGDKSSSSSARHNNKIEEEKKREAEKRTFEKVKQDLSDLASQGGKKARLDGGKDVKEEKSKSREKDKGRDKEREKEKEKEKEKERREKEREAKEKEKKERELEKKEAEKKAKAEVTVISSDSEDEKSLDADDFAFDLGIACIVCRSFDLTSGNQLVECQECHNLYHQDCHRPPVTEQDVNDPRFVWYCSRCAKTLKKMVAVKPSKPKSASSSGSKDPGSGSKSVKSEPTALFPFRRTEPLKSSSARDTASSAAKPLSGLASLAANLSGKASSDTTKAKTDSSRLNSAKADPVKSTSSKIDQHRSSTISSPKVDQSERSSSSSHGSKQSGKSSGGSHKSSSSGGTTSVMNADKRLQMMKKKAAAKQMKSSK